MRQYDDVMVAIADYVLRPLQARDEDFQTARACLADSLGCAILALQFQECTKLLGPIVPDTQVPNGSRVPGTDFVLDPILAAFNIGTMIRWLDYNDTWLAAEWAHPSDNLGGILAIADYVSRVNQSTGKPALTILDVLLAMIQAYEIQGVLAIENSFNRIGFDHVIFVKVATAAVVAKMLGGTRQHVLDAISNAWIDVGPLRTYRHAPNTGSRKSWAAGDATRRGVMLAWMSLQGETGYPTALTAKRWGLNDVLLKDKPLTLSRPLALYVIDNILFKISFPAEFHAQTAVEAAIHLYPKIKDRIEKISSIEIQTHESAIRIIDKQGPLHNPADRDHCLQYMVAIALLNGTLTAEHYSDSAAQDPRIDQLRKKMTVTENKQFSVDYLEPEKRSIANGLTIRFQDGSVLGPIVIEYPIGHRKRRKEGIPLLFRKFSANLKTQFPVDRVNELEALFNDHTRLSNMTVPALMELFLPTANPRRI